MKTVERTYRATAQEVWDLWTTREGFESWWGPQGFRADVHHLEAQVDGRLEYDMVADTPEMVEAMRQMGAPASHPTRARYTELVPQKRLVITSVIDFMPGVPVHDSVIEVEFFPTGEEVRMVVTLHPMFDEQMSGMQLEGFTSQLTKLDERFAIAR